MKIIRIAPFFYPAFGFGGPVNQSLQLSQYQVSKGYDVTVFTSNIQEENRIGKQLLRFENFQGIKICRLPIKFFIPNMQYFITPQLINALLKTKGDIVHIHSFKTFQYSLTTFMKPILNKPIVFSSHGTMINLEQTGILKNSRKMSLFLNNITDNYLKYINLNIPDVILVNSEYEKRLSINYGVQAHRIKVIPHAINPKRFENVSLKTRFLEKFGYKKNEKILLHVGRILKNYRDIHYILEAGNCLKKNYPEIKILIMGENFDNAYKLELLRLRKNFHLEDMVRFEFHPSQDDITGAYLSCYAFLFPTGYRETFGIPILEASAAKKISIAPRICAMPELIENGETGFLYKHKSIDDFLKKIESALEDQTLIEKMGENAYTNVKNNFNQEKIYGRIDKVCLDLI